MSTVWPGALDNYSTGSGSTLLGPTVNNLVAAVDELEVIFGLNPQGAFSTVRARLDAIEFTALNNQAGTAYTLVLSDASKVVGMSNAAANTITIPPNSSVAFVVSTLVLFRQAGAGNTSIVAGAGVTLRARGYPTGPIPLAGQYAWAGAFQVSANVWEAFGDLT